MVCLGNICRSPLAHGILQSKLKEADFFADSAVTVDSHIGKPPDARSIKVAKNNGLDISTQSARQFKVSDFDMFDYIYAMDHSNYNNIMSLAKTNIDIEKVKLLLDINTSIANNNVPDPYYGELCDFEYVYQLIDDTCIELVRTLKG